MNIRRNRRAARAALPTLALIAAMATAMVALWAIGEVGKPSEAEAQGVAPNILYIVLDDADVESMEKYMPNTTARVRDQGASFENFYVAKPICCPSRAAALTGEYPHNNGVLANSGPDGGWAKFKAAGNEERSLGPMMQALNYNTGLHGKYLNGYTDTTLVAPGFDKWFGKWRQTYYDWTATNTNGATTKFGNTSADYADRVLLDRVMTWTGSVAEPFFEYAAPTTPHAPYHDPPGNQSGVSAPLIEPPSFDEQDVSDKPLYIQAQPRISTTEQAAIEDRHYYRAIMTAYLDSKISQALDTLDAAGRLDNTYVVVTSDNGWMEGEHRIPEKKSVPYEESARVPLWISGPGIAPGTTIDAPASNVDLFATFGDIGGTPDLRDGISLLPLATGTGTTTRQTILIEGSGRPEYDAIFDTSTGRELKYIEYDTGERELYDLDADPHELQSIHQSADPALVSDLSVKLAAMKACSGSTCRQ